VERALLRARIMHSRRLADRRKKATKSVNTYKMQERRQRNEMFLVLARRFFFESSGAAVTEKQLSFYSSVVIQRAFRLHQWSLKLGKLDKGFLAQFKELLFGLKFSKAALKFDVAQSISDSQIDNIQA